MQNSTKQNTYSGDKKTCYLIKVYKGKEKRVAEYLKNIYNIDTRRAPIGEYLVCDINENIHEAINRIPEYIKDMKEVPSATAGALMKELVLTKKPEAKELEVNGMVRVVKGGYTGSVGILKKIKEDNTASIHLCLKGGSMRHVNLSVEDIVANHLDRPWGD